MKLIFYYPVEGKGNYYMTCSYTDRLVLFLQSLPDLLVKVRPFFCLLVLKSCLMESSSFKEFRMLSDLPLLKHILRPPSTSRTSRLSATTLSVSSVMDVCKRV